MSLRDSDERKDKTGLYYKNKMFFLYLAVCKQAFQLLWDVL